MPVEGTFVPAIGNASLISSNTPNTGEPFAILILLNNTIMHSTALNEYVSLSITGPKYTYNTMPSQYMPKETNTLALKQLTFIDPDFETASFHMTAGGQLIWGGTSIIANGKTLATEAYVDTYATRISTLETKIGDGFEEITSEEIQALFAS